MPVSVETADVLTKLGIVDGYELVRKDAHQIQPLYLALNSQQQNKMSQIDPPELKPN